MTRLQIKHLLLPMLLLCFFRHGLHAQQIITDRPDQTEASSVIPKKSFQLEIGAQLGEIGKNPNQEKYALLPTALLRYGLFNWLELRFVNQYMQAKNAYSESERFTFSDVELGAKIQLLQNPDINTEIAFITHVVIPTGKSEITNGQLGTINKLSISHTLSKRINIGYNLGYNNFGVGSGIATYSLALGFGLTDKLGFYIEPYGDFLAFETHLANLDGGFTYLLKDNLQLDASAGFGLNYHMYYVSAGVSLNIAKRVKK